MVTQNRPHREAWRAILLNLRLLTEWTLQLFLPKQQNPLSTWFLWSSRMLGRRKMRMTAFHCLDVELDQVYSSYESIFITVLYHPTNDSNKDNPILPRAYFKHFHSVIKKKYLWSACTKSNKQSGGNSRSHTSGATSHHTFIGNAQGGTSNPCSAYSTVQCCLGCCLVTDGKMNKATGCTLKQLDLQLICFSSQRAITRIHLSCL